MKADMVNLLRCPIDGSALSLSADGAWLISAHRRYPMINGIAMLLPEQALALEEKKDE